MNYRLFLVLATGGFALLAAWNGYELYTTSDVVVELPAKELKAPDAAVKMDAEYKAKLAAKQKVIDDYRDYSAQLKEIKRELHSMKAGAKIFAKENRDIEKANRIFEANVRKAAREEALKERKAKRAFDTEFRKWQHEQDKERWQSGRSHRLGKAELRKGPRVRIPPSPPKQ